MNQSRRRFLRAGAAFVATISLAPAGALAFGSEALTVIVKMNGVKEGPAKVQFSIDKEAREKLCALKGRERSAYLSELILEWLKENHPVGRDREAMKQIFDTLPKELARAMKESGADTTPDAASIKITIEITWNPRRIRIRIEF